MKQIKDISYGEFSMQKLDLFLPECNCNEFSIFVYFHGGGLEGGDKSDFNLAAEYLANHGTAVVSANYRMYPAAVYPEFIRDAAEVVAWVNNHIAEYGKCRGIFVGGSSAGGYLSMMLCFDKRYLAPYGISPGDIAGFVHDAGQPTCHFNVLREQGIDSRRVIVDEAAPLFHIGKDPDYPPMVFIVSDSDMENRYEQTQLLLSTMKHFGYNSSKYSLKLMHGSHCHYVNLADKNGESSFGKIINNFIENTI